MIDFNFGDDLGPASPKGKTQDEIKRDAHMINGGEQAMVVCQKCNGSGMTRWGTCFQCQGKGKRSKRSVAASKGAATARANLAAKLDALFQTPEYKYVQKRAGKGSNFYMSILEKARTYGDFSEKVTEIIQRDMAKDAAFYEMKKAEREAARPTIGVEAIEALFNRAIENDLKKPIFRAEGLVLSRAPMHGRNAGALYVKSAETDQYLGKIAGGKFSAAYGLGQIEQQTAKALQVIAEDPQAASIRYGKKFGICGCCGRDLVDPVSIRSGIGPICAERFGFEIAREFARDEIAEERNIEEARRAAGEII